MTEGDLWANALRTTIHIERADGKYWCGFAPQPRHARLPKTFTGDRGNCVRCIKNRLQAYLETQGRVPKYTGARSRE